LQNPVTKKQAVRHYSQIDNMYAVLCELH
jgi:hypothetical protein